MNIRITGFALLAFAVLLVGLGPGKVAKISTLLLFVVFFVIFCMYVGCFSSWGNNNIEENTPTQYEDEWDFIACLALWFPACTGIMAGILRLHLSGVYWRHGGYYLLARSGASRNTIPRIPIARSGASAFRHLSEKPKIWDVNPSSNSISGDMSHKKACLSSPNQQRDVS